MNQDPYQLAYQLHQARKKEQLLQYKADAFYHLATTRKSNRLFKSIPVTHKDLTTISESVSAAPSSCDRHGVSLTLVPTDQIPALGSLLVGARGWLEYAPAVFLIFANPLAYKAPGEIAFMPYLDAGFLAMHLLYVIHSLSLSACYCNPNVRLDDIPVFNSAYNPDSLIFCGAIPLGYPLT